MFRRRQRSQDSNDDSPRSTVERRISLLNKVLGLFFVLIASVLPTVFVSHDVDKIFSSSNPKYAAPASGDVHVSGDAPASTNDEKDRELIKDSTTKERGPYKPHILFVIVDDLGSHDLGMHGTGIKTPVADQLAADGLYMDQFYVHPVCTPTRVGLFTGRFPCTFGIHSPLHISETHGIPLDEEIMPQVMNRAGYDSHLVGKWHVGHAKWGYLPTFRGFKSFFGFAFSGFQDHFKHDNHFKNEKQFKNDNHFKHDNQNVYDMQYDREENCGEGCTKYVDERGNYSSTIFARESIRLIEERAAMPESNRPPLFLVLSYAAMHAPIEMPPEYKDMYNDKKDWSEKRRLYAAMCTAFDDSLGDVIKSLKRSGIWEDTLIIYMSDNGAPTNAGGSNYPLREGKGTIFEGGILVDGIISGPARTKLGIKGGRLKDLFHVVDWLPTLVEIAGGKPNGKPLHGVGQLSTLKGGEPARTDLFLGYSSHSPKHSALRKNQWKVVHNHQSKQTYLYDAIEDQSEKKDLARTYPNITKSLFEQMVSFQRQECPMGTRSVRGDKCGAQKFATTPWSDRGRIPWCPIIAS